MRLWLISLSFALLYLTGCASLPPQQSYNREANASIKSITVLPMPKANVRLHVFNHVGYSFGLIGTLITEANREGKEQWLQETVSSAGFDQFQVIRDTLDAALAERGYELIWPDPLIDDGRSIKRDRQTLHQSYSEVSSDAQLDIGLAYVGYAAAGTGAGEPYRPTVLMFARLVASDGKTVLFNDRIRYHNVFNDQQAIILEPRAEFAYPKFKQLEEAGAGSLEGLRIAVEESARALARQL